MCKIVYSLKVKNNSSKMKRYYMQCQKLISFPQGEIDMRFACVWRAASTKRVGEDSDVGFYSNMKVSLTFSARRWLLILVACLHAADRTAWPVDIYKLIWLRAMAFYKENHLHTTRQLFAQGETYEHAIALNKQKWNPRRKLKYDLASTFGAEWWIFRCLDSSWLTS